MPHIALPDGLPGILGPLAYRPATAQPLLGLADVLLRAHEGLSPGERELIAAAVSAGNGCRFCTSSHAAFAARQLAGGRDVVDATLADTTGAPVSPKLRTLLALAELVRLGGDRVTAAAVDRARAAGADDLEIHDTILIAAAFCMFNRYVDGLATIEPAEPAAYDAMAEGIIAHGYQAGTAR